MSSELWGGQPSFFKRASGAPSDDATGIIRSVRGHVSACGLDHRLGRMATRCLLRIVGCKVATSRSANDTSTGPCSWSPVDSLTRHVRVDGALGLADKPALRRCMQSLTGTLLDNACNQTAVSAHSLPVSLAGGARRPCGLWKFPTRSQLVRRRPDKCRDSPSTSGAS